MRHKEKESELRPTALDEEYQSVQEEQRSNNQDSSGEEVIEPSEEEEELDYGLDFADDLFVEKSMQKEYQTRTQRGKQDNNML